MFSQEVIKKLKSGEVAVISTDTLYGIVGQALRKETVDEIYRLRKRRSEKSCIVLIADMDDLRYFDINPDIFARKVLSRVWPGKVSVVLQCGTERFAYLHRGGKSLAFRLPHNEELRELLRFTGPLIAPSANLEGEKPAETIEEARVYFGDNVETYVDGGLLQGEPSTLIAFEGDVIKVLRQGAVRIDETLFQNEKVV